MANHKSALKRARQSESRNLRNKINKTKVKNVLKNARASLTQESGNPAEMLKRAMSELTRAANKGTIHKRNAARRISRLAKQIHSVKQAANN